MKTFFKISTVAMIVVSIFTACQNDNALVSMPSENATSVDSMKNASAKSTSTANVTTNSNTVTTSFVETNVTPKFGKPNSTMYSFKVFDPNGSLPLSVKLYEKATGTITYVPMVRIGNYWQLSTKISINGWYDWRYVYSVSKSNIGPTAYSLCNTNNTFNSYYSFSTITWPFGADGSTYTNRQGWISGAEPGGCGSGHNEDGHKVQGSFADDTYAEDWNKNCGTTDDNGAEVRSPLDGVVVKVLIDSPSNHHGGYCNAIDIMQEDSKGEQYVFRIAHLKYAPPLSVGDYVRAGYSKIGNIGMSGGTSTSYHGHCVLYLNMFDITYRGLIYVCNAK
ncbi:MAG: hypothetical protein WCO66_02005 [Candidatus Absconditabacteria bacterium]